MKFLIISQVFWPDSTAVSQYLTDLAEELVEKGHDVSVVSSRRQYERPEKRFSAKELHRGVRIQRIAQTGFGKRYVVGRVLDFLSFNINLFRKLLTVRKGTYDVVIGLTAPPLVSFIGALLAGRKGMQFAYWAMDLQPELSIAAGYLKRGSLVAKTLSYFGDTIYRRADRIVALDSYMATQIIRRTGDESRIGVIPLWPAVGEVYTGSRMDNPFRRDQGLGGRFVIMYSGNHSVVHPLDTILRVAWLLREDSRFLFLFIGGGVRRGDVSAFQEKHGLTNVRQLSYQPREDIHLSLGAADLHLVILGNGCAGFCHPSKVYGAMFIGRPVLYIGPRQSHVADLLAECPGNLQASHGASDSLVQDLRAFADLPEIERARIGAANREYVLQRFTRQRLCGRLINTLEGMAPN